MAASASSVRAHWLPQFSAGSLALLKWLGLALMVLDHVDAFVFARSLTWAGELGRLVMPLFAVVLGYNLARPSVDGRARSRIFRRLVAFALLAAAPHAMLTGGHALNILFTFAAAVLVLDLIEAGHRAAALALFLVAGALVEYGWPGIGLVLAVRALYASAGRAEAIAWVLLATVALWPYNGTMAALYALPVAFFASGLSPDLPRLRWAFYWFYPLHLGAFVLLGWAM